MDDLNSKDLAARWRLILGRYSDRALDQVQLDAEQLRLERTLDYLYNREYEQRGHVAGESRHGSLDDSQLTAINWLNQARKLFPQSTFERVQTQAIERYQLDALLKDPQSLKSLEPTPQLAKALLTMRGRMNAQTRDAVRERSFVKAGPWLLWPPTTATPPPPSLWQI